MQVPRGPSLPHFPGAFALSCCSMGDAADTPCDLVEAFVSLLADCCKKGKPFNYGEQFDGTFKVGDLARWGPHVGIVLRNSPFRRVPKLELARALHQADCRLHGSVSQSVGLRAQVDWARIQGKRLADMALASVEM